MKLYLLYVVKGKQDFKVGDNVKDFLEDKYVFKEFRKLLDWSTDFSEELRDAGLMMRQKEGYYDWVGKYINPKTDDQLINASMVICSESGKIHGILKINKHS